MKINNLFIVLLSFLLAITQCKSEKKEKTALPNIVLIMGDDIGYSDIGCYGSEINTPNLDELAEQGIRFRTFYNAAKCETTRSSLLTGLYHGDDRTVHIAGMLKQQGYATICTGKEHFTKWIPENCYAANCFDYSFYYWAINEYFIPPDSIFSNSFYSGKKKLDIKDIEFEQEPFYKTDVVTDYAIRFLEEAKKQEGPFLLYLPYHSAHYPLQARPEDIQLYLDTYKVGWDTIRQSRFERMKTMGIIDETCRLSEPSDNINKFRGHPKDNKEKRAKIPLYRPWKDLSASEQGELSLEMAVFAAMVTRMDINIGRIVTWLKENGETNNTLIMYLSDNGSCPYDSNRDFDHLPGPADSYRTLSAAWANVGNTPFRYFKQFGHEGGCNTQFIVRWPEKINEGFITDQPGHIVDIVPTLIDVAQLEYPSEVNGKTAIPLHGSSLLPIFEGEQRIPPEYFISGFTERFRMFRTRDWKIVKANGEKWEMYNLKDDRTEVHDLADSLPDKVQELSEDYERIRTKMEMN